MYHVVRVFFHCAIHKLIQLMLESTLHVYVQAYEEDSLQYISYKFTYLDSSP